LFSSFFGTSFFFFEKNQKNKQTNKQTRKNKSEFYEVIWSAVLAAEGLEVLFFFFAVLSCAVLLLLVPFDVEEAEAVDDRFRSPEDCRSEINRELNCVSARPRCVLLEISAPE